MKTRMEKKPTARVPSITALPPTRRVIVKPRRIAILTRGVKAELSRMALRLASR